MSEDTDHRPFAANLQGVAIGLILGNTAALAHSLHWPVLAVALVLLSAGYYFDRKSRNTDGHGDREPG